MTNDVLKLQAACDKMLISCNHIALYQTDDWPPVGTDHSVALEKLKAGLQYDMWCCWNGHMLAREEIAN